MDEYILEKLKTKRAQKNKPATVNTNSINQSLINEDLDLTKEEKALVIR